MKTFVRAALVAGLLATSAAGVAMAQAQTPAVETQAILGTALNLSAYGETRVAPDMATISLGVMTEAKTAAEAMRANAARMNQVMQSLRSQGIAERDTQTSNLTLSPQYRYVQNEAPELTGYQASNTVTIRVMDLSRLGSAIDAVVSVGANQVHGISFGLKDPKAAEDAARREAVAALGDKANLYASALRKQVLRLVSLTEGANYSPPPPMPLMAARAAFDKAESTPVAAGEIVVRVDVSAVYELSR